MGVGVSCPRCKNNFPFCCSNCGSFQTVINETPKFFNYFQTRTVYYIRCLNCNREYDDFTCPNCSKKILPQYPFVSGDSEISKRKNCFIATACLGEDSHLILPLYVIRDEVLNRSYFGRQFIRYYYRYSPCLAPHISRRKPLKLLVRYLLVYPVCIISSAFIKISSQVR